MPASRPRPVVPTAASSATATPRVTPIFGRTPYPNLLLNLGHGALGFTLALGCARVIADLVAGEPPEVPLDGFALA